VVEEQADKMGHGEKKPSHCCGFSTIVWLLTRRKVEARRTVIPKESTGKKHTMRVRRAFVADR